MYNGAALGTGVLTIGTAGGNNATLKTLATTNLDNVGTITIGDGLTPGGNTSGIDTAAGTTLTINQGLQGVSATDTFQKLGGGILELNGNNSFAGDNQVLAGTLRINDNTAGNLPGNMTIFENARLEGTGSVSAGASTVTNAGTIEPGSFTNPYGTLTIGGNYAANAGGQLVVNNILTDDGSPSSVLLIQGDSQGNNPTDVRVINHNGGGGIATQGIEFARIQGSSTGSEFRLLYDYLPNLAPSGAVVGGTTLYYMDSYLQGSDRVFVLRTLLGPDGRPVDNPAIPLYEGYGAALQPFTELQTLRQRVGNRTWGSYAPTNPYESESAYASPASVDRRYVEQSGMWTRMEGSLSRFQPSHSYSPDLRTDIDFWRMHLGYDRPLFCATDGSVLVGGISVHYGQTNADVKSRIGNGNIKTRGIGLTGTLTWYGSQGFYADLQAMMDFLSSDLKSRELVHARQADNNEAFAHMFSLEVGKSFDFCDGWSFTPQIQIKSSSANVDAFTDAQNVRVNQKKNRSLLGRLGLGVDKTTIYTAANGDRRRLMAYGLANGYQEFAGAHEVEVAGTTFASRESRTWVGAAVGATYDWCDSRYSVYGELGGRTNAKNFADSHVLYGQVGFRLNF